MIDIIIMILVTAGALATLLAAIGLLRMPDLYIRLSVATKASTLGAGLVLAGTALFFSDVSITSRVISIIFFITITAPVSAHLIVRAAYFTNTRLWKHSVQDDMAEMYDKESHQLSSGEEKEK